MNRIPLRVAAPLAALFALACGDAPTEPAALLVAEHARAALDVSVPLPSLAGAEALSTTEFGAVLRDLGVWLDAAEAGLDEARAAAHPAVADLRVDVRRGRSLLDDATRLEAGGDRAAAVASLAEAESWLVRTTTHAVAESRLEAAAAAEMRCLARSVVGPAASQANIERGRRLLAHAREAMTDGETERALQRAHYAEALLAGECPEPPRQKRGGRR